MLGPNLSRDLGVHQRLGEHPHALAQEIDIGTIGLAQQLHQFHGGHGHRSSPLDVLIRPFTSRTYAVATLVFSPGGCSYTNPWDANEDLNLRLHPYQQNAGNRCAKGSPHD
jgi:hypothetical protein